MKVKLFISSLMLALVSLLAVSPAKADGIALSQTVQASQTATYQFEVQNDTAVDHTYSLALDGLPNTLVASFSQGGPLVDKIMVAANGYSALTLNVDVPTETIVGHYTAQVSITRDDGQTLNYPLSLTVENTYALQIVSQSTNLNAFSGQEFSFDVTVANQGAAAVTNATLVVDAPAKWIIVTDPATLPSIQPGDETTVHVRAAVPSSQTAQDQKISLSLTSDQTTSPDSILTVRIQKSPTFFYGALGIIGLAIAGVFLYFRSQGRR